MQHCTKSKEGDIIWLHIIQRDYQKQWLITAFSELELTGVMANVAVFKHLLRNANFHVYCDHSALVHILKAKREPPTLKTKETDRKS